MTVRSVAAWGLATLSIVITAATLMPPALAGIDGLVAAVPIVPVCAGIALMLRRRAWSSALALAALIGSGIAIAREVGSRDAHAAGQDRSVIVVTHNVGRANVAPRATIAALAASGADIVLLQETDGTVAPYLAGLRRTYPYANACRRRCSMAIFSRWPLTQVRWRFHDAAGAAHGPALYTTAVRLPWGERATLATLHLSRSLSAADRAARRDALGVAVRRAGTDTMILAGDFNLTPWGGAMRRLDDALYPMRRATRALMSFPARWNRQAVPAAILPIDHLYAGPRWTMLSARRMARTGSDHYPIRINLLWRSTGL